MFVVQEISIQSFTPEKIPISGNILITINGNNFDVGDASLSRIEIAAISCEIQ